MKILPFAVALGLTVGSVGTLLGPPGLGLAQSPAETPIAATDIPTEAPLPADTPVPPTDVPAAVATEASSETPAEAPPPEGTGENGDDNTQWIVIGLIAVAGLAVVILVASWFGRRGGRAAPDGASFQSHAFVTYGKAAALHDAIAVEIASSTPVTPDPDGRRRWQDFQPRIDDLTTELHVLEVQATKEVQASTVRQMLASLAALRASAVPDAPPAPESATAAADSIALHIRQRLAEFDVQVRALRQLL